LAISKLPVTAKDLINKSQPYYQETFRGQELSDKDWFQLIIHRPDLLKAPIALYKGKAVQCLTETDLLKLN
jgi:arsenate reductase